MLSPTVHPPLTHRSPRGGGGELRSSETNMRAKEIASREADGGPPDATEAVSNPEKALINWGHRLRQPAPERPVGQECPLGSACGTGPLGGRACLPLHTTGREDLTGRENLLISHTVDYPRIVNTTLKAVSELVSN